MGNKKLSKPEFRQNVLPKCNGRCAYCGCDLSTYVFEIDHIIPKRKYKFPERYQNLERGSDEIENLLPACQSCNACKSDLTLEQFRERVLDRISRINSFSEYQIAKRFGLVTENSMPIVFYFEKLKENA